MQLISSFKEIYNQYDYFIFDIWGVIHDGSKSYAGALETILFLRQNGKKICFLSNAPRRAFKVAKVLEKFGITKNLYDFILSSGEETFIDLQKNQQNGFKDFGQNYFYIGPKKDSDLLEGLDYFKVNEASLAHFAITTGFDNDDSVLAEKLSQIIDAKKQNLKLICVNPDMIVVKQNGKEIICAGTLALEYQKLGGEVIFYGKPFLSAYKTVCEIFNHPQNKKILMIGDGMETDIKGANNFGIDSVLVTGGILSKSTKTIYNQLPNQKQLEKIFNQYQLFPNFVISNLKI
jgi:HAD superfamily hydrolase (TIGR01459 family)